MVEEFYPRTVCGMCGGDEPDLTTSCDECGVVVHTDCYGIPPSTALDDTIKAAGRFLCHACVACATRQQCALCCSGGGALIRTAEGHWVHGVCALYVQQVSLRPDLAKGGFLAHGVPQVLLKLQLLLRGSDTADGSSMGASSPADIEMPMGGGCPRNPRCMRDRKHPGLCRLPGSKFVRRMYGAASSKEVGDAPDHLLLLLALQEQTPTHAMTDALSMLPPLLADGHADRQDVGTEESSSTDRTLAPPPLAAECQGAHGPTAAWVPDVDNAAPTAELLPLKLGLCAAAPPTPQKSRSTEKASTSKELQVELVAAA